MSQWDLKSRQALLAVARGEAPADLLLRGAQVVNVYTREVRKANVAVAGGRIAYVGPSEGRIGPATEVVEASGLFLSPGLIEVHAHPWVFYNPVSQIEAFLPWGTTFVVNDNLFFFLRFGPEGFTRMLDLLAGLPIRYRWVVRLLSQSEFAGERDMFALERVLPLLKRPEVIGTAEVTRWPAVYAGDPHVLAGLEEARRLGKVRDGHTAGASAERLNAVVAAGVDACHEAITAEQVLDRLRLGLWTPVRHSSVRPDLAEILPGILAAGVDTQRLLLTTDGSSPTFLDRVRGVAGLLQQAVELGMPALQALQLVTLNAATFLGVDREFGGIAPGRWADMVLFPDLTRFEPVAVYVGGRPVAAAGALTARLPEVDWGELAAEPHFPAGAREPDAAAFSPGGTQHEVLPVIELISNVITKDGGRHLQRAGDPLPEGRILAVLVGRDGRWQTRALVGGLLPRLGALATTYNTTTDLLVLGRDPASMAVAAGRVRALGGGVALAEGERVVWEYALPVAGVMATSSFAGTVEALAELEARVRQAGYPHGDILYSLLFLACDFLPGLRLTPRGVLDVVQGEIVTPARPL